MISLKFILRMAKWYNRLDEIKAASDAGIEKYGNLEVILSYPNVCFLEIILSPRSILILLKNIIKVYLPY